MAYRHGEYGQSRGSRWDQRREGRYGRDDEEREGGRARWEESDSPEVTGFGRNVADEYRRYGGDWDADTDDRGNRRWSSGGDYGSYEEGRSQYGRRGDYDEGRVQYGQRGGAQRARQEDQGYGRYGRSSEYGRGGDWGRGSDSRREDWGRDDRESGQRARGEWDEESEGGRSFGDRLRDFGRRAFGQHEMGGRPRFGGSQYGDYNPGGYGSGSYGQGGYGAAGGAWSGGSTARQMYGQDYAGGQNISSEFGMGGSQVGLFRGSRGQMARGFRGRGPRGYQRSDERLKEMICEMLTEDDEIDASDIEVNVSNGEVTLDGTVEDRSTKYMVEDRVGNMSGVKDVRNNLRVKQQSQWSQSSQSSQSQGAFGSQSDAQQSHQRSGQSSGSSAGSSTGSGLFASGQSGQTGRTGTSSATGTTRSAQSNTDESSSERKKS